MKLEICVDSYESLQNALSHGADRIELCSALSLGGLSPTPGNLLLASRLHSVKPVFVMVRPRAGDFCYTNDEFEGMLEEIRIIKKLGFPGIVVGVLTEDGKIDIPRLKKIAVTAENMSITFHRAFDNGADPVDMIEDLISLGIDRLLTSGQAKTAMEGAKCIGELQRTYGSRIVIMPGSGITSESLEELIRLTECREYHLSAKKMIPSRMRFNKDFLPIPDEPYRFNDGDEIARAKAILTRYEKKAETEFESKKKFGSEPAFECKNASGYKNAPRGKNASEIKPKYDPGFIPIIRLVEEYRRRLSEAEKTLRFTFAILRNQTPVKIVGIDILDCFDANEQYRDHHPDNIGLSDYSPAELTVLYVERIIKTHLWIVGGDGIAVDGPKTLYDFIKEQYRKGGARDFDVTFFTDVFGKAFDVSSAAFELSEKTAALPHSINCKPSSSDIRIPGTNPPEMDISFIRRPLRLGLDLGGSTLKLTLLEKNHILCQTEDIWTPKTEPDPDYHFHHIVDTIRRALSISSRNHKEISFIGFSSAGIVLDNRVVSGSIFRSVPATLKEKAVHLFERISLAFGGIPYKVVNDGEIAALAATLGHKKHSVLGLTLGTSLGCGYLNHDGELTDQINEPAFVPLDLSPAAIIDEWSKDRGAGVSYLSQDAVLKLAQFAGLKPEGTTPSEQFRSIAGLLNESTDRKTTSKKSSRIIAETIFKDIGIYLAYAVAYYREFYDFKHIVLLGGVAAGEHGKCILKSAKDVLNREYPELFRSIEFLTEDQDSHLQDYVAATIPTSPEQFRYVRSRNCSGSNHPDRLSRNMENRSNFPNDTTEKMETK